VIVHFCHQWIQQFLAVYQFACQCFIRYDFAVCILVSQPDLFIDILIPYRTLVSIHGPISATKKSLSFPLLGASNNTFAVSRAPDHFPMDHHAQVKFNFGRSAPIFASLPSSAVLYDNNLQDRWKHYMQVSYPGNTLVIFSLRIFFIQSF
jgi:hypothetical protein